MGNPKKREREDGQCSAGLVLSFRKGIETRNERQTSTNRSDSKPQKSRLFSVLCGLKDGVHLIRSVINLLSKEEMTVYYRHLGRPLIEYYSDAGLAVRHVSDEDMGVIVPSHVFLDRVLTAFEVLPRPVLVHCSAGAERSALAVDFICNQWRTRLQKPVVKPHKKSPAKKRRT